jgi:APA family basic amino acid/polyamine antiporter
MAEAQAGKMGLWMTTSFVIGSIIGVAIFMLPIALAPLGINAVVGWLVSGCGAVCLGVPLARLTRGGAGIQSAVEGAFGHTVGFMVTWAFWVSLWSGLAAIAVGAASTISRVVPALANPLSVALMSAALIGLTVPVNVRGARASGAMAIVILLLRTIPLAAVVIIVVVKAAALKPLQPLWTKPVTMSSAATATALTLFAFTGFENVSAPVGKIRDSHRIIPSALLIALTTVALVYLTTSTSVMLLLPPERLAHSPAPFADAVAASWGEVSAYVIVAGIAISAFGCIGCGSMAAGELCYSMALNGDLPKALAWTNSRGAPVLGQAISAALAIVLVLSNASRSTAGLFAFIVLVSTVAVLMLYVVAALAIASRDRALGTRTLAFAGIIFGVFAFYGSGLEASLWGVGLAMSALPICAIWRWRGGSPHSAATIPTGPPEPSPSGSAGSP